MKNDNYRIYIPDHLYNQYYKKPNRNKLKYFKYICYMLFFKFRELYRIVSNCSFVEVATYSYKLLSQGNT
ncbi:hypothetical protein DPE44_15375 [Salmonella enterica subsp. salamae]|nr:hypothetical protein [Salmonella enterica subsp. salamae]EAM5459566.1 hypothetical protein [Salmonella enterica]ECD9409815.1 hypothetical protein [Salmonella enterica subsp. salamae]ECJ2554298.1 hypothetical protein [Salmonella enterica subsp. salamae]EDU0567765.1 hypothetical protein [Salmonella enterica subsp. salamae]